MQTFKFNSQALTSIFRCCQFKYSSQLRSLAIPYFPIKACCIALQSCEAIPDLLRMSTSAPSLILFAV